MQDYTNKMGTYILSEKDMNDRKRLFNREAGRKAIVNEVCEHDCPKLMFAVKIDVVFMIFLF